MKRRWWTAFVVVVAGLGGAAVWSFHARTASQTDFGAWRVIVLQSDDWGFEGWFPDRAAADSLADLARGVPPKLRAYARSGLETAAEVDSLRVRLLRLRDADGLPLVLQANTVMAGPTVRASGAAEAPHAWPIHPSGRGPGRYARPGLDAAVDRAIGAGVYRPELHGLTHFDLEEYAVARDAGDPVAARARRFDTMAYRGWLRGTELSGSDPVEARRIAEAAIDRFRARFGRAPSSVIAPDYRWGREDEDAWADLGVQAVQAKREQVDGRVDPTTAWGRVRKVLERLVDRWRSRFVYLDRPARLEPYGDSAPDAAQGARAAAAAVREAWERGEPGIVSVHRVQLVSYDAPVARAGWKHLRALFAELSGDGPVRCLVDAEVAQLWRRGWSVIERGPWRVVRNFGDGPVEIDPGDGRGPRSFPVGTHVLGRDDTVSGDPR